MASQFNISKTELLSSFPSWHTYSFQKFPHLYSVLLVTLAKIHWLISLSPTYNFSTDPVGFIFTVYFLHTGYSVTSMANVLVQVTITSLCILALTLSLVFLSCPTSVYLTSSCPNDHIKSEIGLCHFPAQNLPIAFQKPDLHISLWCSTYLSPKLPLGTGLLLRRSRYSVLCICPSFISDMMISYLFYVSTCLFPHHFLSLLQMSHYPWVLFSFPVYIALPLFPVLFYSLVLAII